MLQQRERRPVPTSILPAPAPLPNLRAALARRAEIFGPQQIDADGHLEPAAEVAPLGLWRTLEQAARDAVVTLAELRSVGSGA